MVSSSNLFNIGILINLFIANGCGYSNKTLDYPYLYFPAPDVTNISSDPLTAFKYAICVKECPTANASEPISCVEPSFFVTEKDKFKDC